ncbi:MAG: Lrp/AsnC family transcriptional regulator [Gemmatimonadaceae bacterium]|nr:Lrp/AsnC family transcriptional regulator [Gemmatimonadaceae bacterium]
MQTRTLDATDRTIIERLMHDGRATWAALGELTDLSPAALAQRVRRLEREGVIQGYAARIDPVAVDASLLAFVLIRFSDPARRERFLTRVDAFPWLQECHHVTGEMDYLLKVRCASVAELEHIITGELRDTCKVTESRTSIVLMTRKETTAVPIGECERAQAHAHFSAPAMVGNGHANGHHAHHGPVADPHTP